MRNRRWLWAVAVVVTLASAVFQRMTGPTYPVRGHVTLGSQDHSVRLTRTHGGPGDQPVRLVIPDSAVGGEVAWRRYPTGPRSRPPCPTNPSQGNWNTRSD
jgi:hypothetical protein